MFWGFVGIFFRKKIFYFDVHFINVHSKAFCSAIFLPLREGLYMVLLP